MTPEQYEAIIAELKARIAELEAKSQRDYYSEQNRIRGTHGRAG